MAHRFPDDVVFVAHQFSKALTTAANRLDGAGDAASFVAALQAQAGLWHDMAALGQVVGCEIPEAVVDFVLATTNRPQACVDDQAVEAMIAINRRLAAELARISPDRPASRSLSLWSAWMNRQVDAIRWQGRGDAPRRKPAIASRVG